MFVMSRIFTIDNELDAKLRAALLKTLRPGDEATVLPAAMYDDQMNTFKNVAFRFSATEPDVPSCAFSSCDFWSGVSAVEVTGTRASSICNDPVIRAAALARLSEVITSETHCPDSVVGPQLDGDATDCDTDTWVAGFGSASAFVGLFAASHSTPPTPSTKGMDRAHERVFLVCKAGGGQAAAQFASRLSVALLAKKTLQQALEDPAGSPGPAALRRVSRAGSRNRARIIGEAAAALEIDLDTSPDQSSKGLYRLPALQVDVHSNTIRPVVVGEKAFYQTGSCLDAVLSKGLLTHSNLSDGMRLFVGASGDLRVTLRNEAWSCLPLATPRLKDAQAIIGEVINSHRRQGLKSGDAGAHPDHAFIADKFVWRNRLHSGKGGNFAPLALWGSHAKEAWISTYARELGVAGFQCVNLSPAAVCVAGVEGSHTRAMLRAIDQ